MILAQMVLVLDVILLLTILFCAVEGSRQVVFRQEPARSLAFVLVGVSMFAMALTEGITLWRGPIYKPSWFELMAHAGIMLSYVLHLLRRAADRKQAQCSPHSLTSSRFSFHR